MMIWIIFVFMAALVMAGLLLPVALRPGPVAQRQDYDRAVFRDQLAELDRDVARGAIAPAEAEAARNEISRRLLQAATPAAPRTAIAGKPIVAVTGAALVPALALLLYVQLGHPTMPDVPLAARLDNAVQNQDFDALIAKVEKHLAVKPDDVEGWRVLAPAYRGVRRWDDAASAYANLFKLEVPTPALIADYGEMLVFANEGMVTAEASRAFGEALKLDPKLPKARFFNALALKQEGKHGDARAALEALLSESPNGAPWRKAVETELKDLASLAPALTQDQMAEGASMSAGDRDVMIRSMVDGLEAKLKDDGNNLEGWQRLIRARTVLREPDKAKAALTAAKEVFRGKPEAVAALDGLARELGI